MSWENFTTCYLPTLLNDQFSCSKTSQFIYFLPETSFKVILKLSLRNKVLSGCDVLVPTVSLHGQPVDLKTSIFLRNYQNLPLKKVAISSKY